MGVRSKPLVKLTTCRATVRPFLVLLVCLACLDSANAQVPTLESTSESDESTSQLLKKVDQLVEQNQKLQKQNRELMEQIESLRSALIPSRPTKDATPTKAQPATGPTLASSDSHAAASKNEPQDPPQDENAPSGREYGRLTTWNVYEPGQGFDIAKSEYASLNISGYLVARYLNQLPPSQSFVDHLGRTQNVDTRQDFQLHRVMLYFTGNLFNPKFNYNITLWTVNDTAQQAIVGALYYFVNKHLIFGVGWNGIPGTRSMQGSHPYWTSYDRVMADEFFRPYFTQAVFAQGSLGHRLEYKYSLGNNLSNLDITAVKLTRDLSQGVSLTWLPTTGEFGPRGAFGDYEEHQSVATRFGIAYTHSREDRFNTSTSEAPDNTAIRLGDSLLLFGTGSLTPGVTVQKATYQLLAADGGVKYKGFWLQSEGYFRLLNNFVADGPLPVGSIRDQGFYVQTAYMVAAKKIELYGATSWVFPRFHPTDTKSPHEALGGLNWYPTDSRNYRLNVQAISVLRSPVSSTFGFYTGGLRGVSFTLGATALF
jgi:hypothetical protein